MKTYKITFEFEAEDDQEASNIYADGYYLEADGIPSWKLLPPKESAKQ